MVPAFDSLYVSIILGGRKICKFIGNNINIIIERSINRSLTYGPRWYIHVPAD